jgi:hypothetical protein
MNKYMELKSDKNVFNQLVERIDNAWLISENKKLNRRIRRLESAIVKTLNNNRHLADGNDCTLIDIKNSVNWE